MTFESVLAEVLIILGLRHIAYDRSKVVPILRSRHNSALEWFNVATQTATVAFVDVELASMKLGLLIGSTRGQNLVDILLTSGVP